MQASAKFLSLQINLADENKVMTLQYEEDSSFLKGYVVMKMEFREIWKGKV